MRSHTKQPRLSRRVDPDSLRAAGILVDHRTGLPYTHPDQLHPAALRLLTGRAYGVCWQLPEERLIALRMAGLPGVRAGETEEQARRGLREVLEEQRQATCLPRGR